jgi:hypothetical protein
MAMGLQGEGARIYEFPAKVTSLAAKRRAMARFAEAERASLRAPRIVYGSGWYHEEAVQEAVQKAGQQKQ